MMQLSWDSQELKGIEKVAPKSEIAVEEKGSAITQHKRILLSTTEIAKLTRKQLKSEFPGCKFSVTTEYYAGGSSITLALMKSDRKVIADFENISAWALQKLGDMYTEQSVQKTQQKRSHQLNRFSLIRDYDPEEWCNGTFLTEQGHTLMQRAVNITEQYNYEDNDRARDYYGVNFHLSVDLGKWDRGFEDGAGEG